jgi:hypothetical protein
LWRWASRARTSADLSAFFDLSVRPRTFIAIPTIKRVQDFINDKTPPTPPDDD